MANRMAVLWLAMSALLAGGAYAGEEAPPPDNAVFADEPVVQYDPDVLASAEFLPVDKFDEYLTGEEPPHPWALVGEPAEGVSVLLQPWAESPVTGNGICGKGIVLDDASDMAGDGCGFATDFPPPPAGALQLSFDFYRNRPVAPQSPGLICRLGEQLLIQITGEGEVLTLDAAGAPDAVGHCEPETWYHLSVLMQSGSDRAQFSLTPHPGQKSGSGSLGEMAAFVEQPIAAPLKYPASLSFVLGGDPAAKGAWSVDNVCLAGNVVAPRARWWPFTPTPRAELLQSPKKVFTYNFPPHGAGQGGANDPATNWNFTAEWLNPLRPRLEEDRKGAGAKTQYMPLPRPQRPELDKWQALSLEMAIDVRLAKQQGNDGFIMDLNQAYGGGWGYLFNRKTYYTLDAAAREGDFAVLPAVYSAGGGSGYGQADEKTDPAAYARHEIFKRVLSHPATLRAEDGKPVISQWGAERHSPAWWQRVLDTFASDGTPVKFVAQFNNYAKFDEFAPVAWGMSDWGPREPDTSYTWIERARKHTTVVGTPIVMQDVRTRGCDSFESRNSATFRKLWMYAITGNADWAVINTWNDFSEQAQMPSTLIGFTLYDLNAYYGQWFKTGVQPPVVRDVLYYFYRRQHTDAPQNHGDKWHFRKVGDVDRVNEIELLAFLKEPGTLRIRVGEEEFRQEAPAGITSFTVPLPFGRRFVPYFAVDRGGAEVLGANGRYTVYERVEFPNMLYHGGVIVR